MNVKLEYKIKIFSFKEIKNFFCSEKKNSFYLKKFCITKSPFKEKKTKEQYSIKTFFFFLNNIEYSPKIYEIFFQKYIFLGNIKFFKKKKIEKWIISI